jgi:hypothetical protein
MESCKSWHCSDSSSATLESGGRLARDTSELLQSGNHGAQRGRAEAISFTAVVEDSRDQSALLNFQAPDVMTICEAGNSGVGTLSSVNSLTSF